MQIANRTVFLKSYLDVNALLMPQGRSLFKTSGLSPLDMPGALRLQPPRLLFGPPEDCLPKES
jgi:hypothetical protein